MPRRQDTEVLVMKTTFICIFKFVI
jgi:hypothetical protein